MLRDLSFTVRIQPKRTFLSLQKKYDCIERTLVEAVHGYGERKARPSTDDKISEGTLSEGTRKLIEKCTASRRKSHLNRADQMELCELKKLIKREIRKNIWEYMSRGALKG